MLTVFDVARWFLSKESMTHKKLQKMCYYAQAWYCALFNEGPLFNEEIQAWVHGPVCPALYAKYSGYRWNEIPKEEFDASNFSVNAVEALEAVYESYGEYDGDQLEWLTHSETPWQEARGNLKKWETCTNAISTEKMREFYWARYEADQND